MVYTVFVDDNYHYMDEPERYKLGEFADCEPAAAACKLIVDTFLEGADRDCSADELFTWIGSEDRACRFSAWTYARQRCSELGRVS